MREILIAFLKTGSGSLSNLVLAVVKTKIIALFLGPRGIGLYSVLRQTLQTTATLATCNGGPALIQGLSKYRGKAKENYLITVTKIFIINLALITIILWLFAPSLARWIFAKQDASFIALVRWLSVPILLFCSNIYMMGVLNGYRAIGRMAVAQVAGGLASVFFVYPLVRLGEPKIFIILLSTIYGTSFLVSTYFAIRVGLLKPLRQLIRDSWQKDYVQHFFSIALIMLVTGFVKTGSILATRVMFVWYGGLSAAGIFDVAWTLSMAYVMLVLNAFGTYYLPTLSGVQDSMSRMVLIQRLLRVTITIIVPLITTVIVFKTLVIHIFYSKEFESALIIIRWMLIGDYLKATSWVLAMPMLAYADMRIFFWTEISWNLGFITVACLSILLLNQVEGVGIGFVSLYFFYMIYTVYYCKTRYGLNLSISLKIKWLAGLMVVVGASVFSWAEDQPNLINSAYWIGLALLISLWCLIPAERNKYLFDFER